MPDTLIGHRAQERDLELIDFLWVQLDTTKGTLPVRYSSRKLFRQDALCHSSALTRSYCCKVFDRWRRIRETGGARSSPGLFGDTERISWQAEGAYCVFECTPDRCIRPMASWLFGRHQEVRETLFRYFVLVDTEHVNDRMSRAQNRLRVTIAQAYPPWF